MIIDVPFRNSCSNYADVRDLGKVEMDSCMVGGLKNCRLHCHKVKLVLTGAELWPLLGPYDPGNNSSGGGS